MNSRIVESTPFGPVVLVWTRLDGVPRIVQVLLSSTGSSAVARLGALYPDSRSASCREIDAVAGTIKAFLAGKDVSFPLEIAAVETRPAFQQAVIRAEHAVPRGSVTTYGRIARRLGREGAARAVGNALATNPFPIIVPCHRAVRSDGRLGGYQGGPAMKRALLEREGITFDERGRVAVPRFHYS